MAEAGLRVQEQLGAALERDEGLNARIRDLEEQLAVWHAVAAGIGLINTVGAQHPGNSHKKCSAVATADALKVLLEQLTEEAAQAKSTIEELEAGKTKELDEMQSLKEELAIERARHEASTSGLMAEVDALRHAQEAGNAASSRISALTEELALHSEQKVALEVSPHWLMKCCV